jgi:arylamine N-acetyltransferase
VVPLAERLPPSPEQAVEDVFSGVGGMCWTLNCVFYILIKELGYDVHPLAAAIADPSDTKGHMMILVRNVVKEGDKYLVDVGAYDITFKPIPMDFTEESPKYRLNHRTLKLIKRGDTYIRCGLISPGQKPRFPIIEGDWVHMLFFTLKPWTLNDIQKLYLESVLVEKSLFCRIRTIRLSSASLDPLFVLKNYTLVIDNNHGSVMEEIVLENEDDVVATVSKYFPAIDSEIVKASYRTYHLYDQHIIHTKGSHP